MQAVIDFFVMINVYFLDAVNSVFPDAQPDEIYFNTLAITAFATWVLYVVKCLTSYTRKDLEEVVAEEKRLGEVAARKTENNYYRELKRLTDQIEELEVDLATVNSARKRESVNLEQVNKQLAEANELINKISTTGVASDDHKLERVIVSLLREEENFEAVEARAQRIVDALED